MAEAVRQAISSLKEEIRCSLCLETLRNPVTSKCFHNFCSACAENLIRSSRSKLKCPDCNLKLTKTSFNSNDKLARIIDGIINVIQHCNKDMSDNGLIPTDKLHLFQSQSFCSSRFQEPPVGRIQILVDKSFDKCVEDGEESVEQVFIDSESDQETKPAQDPPTNDDKEPATVSRRSVVWEKSADNNPIQSTCFDPYEFVPSQRPPTIVRKRGRSKGLNKFKPKAEDVKRAVDVKKRKLGVEVAKQNEFYDTVIGTETSLNIFKLPKLKRKLVDLEIEKITASNKRSPFVEDETERADETKKAERVKNNKKFKKVKFIESDWSSTQVEKMEELNKQFTSFDETTLNIVTDKDDRKRNRRTAEEEFNKNSFNVEKPLTPIFEEPQINIVEYCETPSPTVAGNTQQFTVASFEINSDKKNSSPVSNRSQKSSSTWKKPTNSKIREEESPRKSLKDLLTDIIDSQVSLVRSQNEILAGDSELVDVEPVLNYENVPDSQNVSSVLTDCSRKVLEESQLPLKSNSKKIRSPTEAKHAASSVKIERTRLKKKTALEEISSGQYDGDDDLDVLASLLQSFSAGEWRRIERKNSTTDTDQEFIAQSINNDGITDHQVSSEVVVSDKERDDSICDVDEMSDEVVPDPFVEDGPQSLKSTEEEIVHPSAENGAAEVLSEEAPAKIVISRKQPENSVANVDEELPSGMVHNLDSFSSDSFVENVPQSLTSTEEEVVNPSAESDVADVLLDEASVKVDISRKQPETSVRNVTEELPSEIVRNLDNFSSDRTIENGPQSLELTQEVVAGTEPASDASTVPLAESGSEHNSELFPDDILNNFDRIFDDDIGNNVVMERKEEIPNGDDSNDVTIIESSQNLLEDNNKAQNSILRGFPEHSTQQDSNDEPLLECGIISPIAKQNITERSAMPENQERSPTLENQENNVENSSALLNSIELTQNPFILCFSGFSTTEMTKLNEFCGNFQLESRRHFDKDVTHLVTKTRNIHGSELCERTMKFFQSMARRIWIISHHWVNRCLEADKLLPVDSFVVSGDTVDGAHNGPEKARTANLNSLLFKNISFFCVEPIENFTEISQLEELLKECGGEICCSLNDISKRCSSGRTCFIIVQEGEHSVEFFNDLYKKYHVPVVDMEFILVCLSRYTVIPQYDDFVLCSKDLLAEDFEVDDSDSSADESVVYANIS